MPVLFLPGNAGSYAQVRSLASETARQTQRSRERWAARHSDAATTCSAAPRAAEAITAGGDALAVDRHRSHDCAGCSCAAVSGHEAEDGSDGGFSDLAWYAADFGEELSALDGRLLVRMPPLKLLCSCGVLRCLGVHPRPCADSALPCSGRARPQSPALVDSCRPGTDWTGSCQV